MHWLSPGYCDREPGITDRLRNMIRSTPVAGYPGCCHAISALDFTEALARVKLPTLLMVGEHDHGVPLNEFRKIQYQISGSQLPGLPGAFHLSNIDAADEFNRYLTAFLRLQPGKTS